MRDWKSCKQVYLKYSIHSNKNLEQYKTTSCITNNLFSDRILARPFCTEVSALSRIRILRLSIHRREVRSKFSLHFHRNSGHGRFDRAAVHLQSSLRLLIQYSGLGSRPISSLDDGGQGGTCQKSPIFSHRSVQVRFLSSWLYLYFWEMTMINIFS